MYILGRTTLWRSFLLFSPPKLLIMPLKPLLHPEKWQCIVNMNMYRYRYRYYMHIDLCIMLGIHDAALQLEEPVPAAPKNQTPEVWVIDIFSICQLAAHTTSTHQYFHSPTYFQKLTLIISLFHPAVLPKSVTDATKSYSYNTRPLNLSPTLTRTKIHSHTSMHTCTHELLSS